jgi:polysaccharide biosynthesis transport protein
MDNSAAVESQLAIMRSDKVARKAIQSLGLDSDPDFKVANEGRVTRWLGPELAELLGRSPLRTPERIERFRMDLLQAMVEIRRVPGTFAVEIAALSDKSAKAAELANSITAAYLSEHIEKKQDLSTRTVGWLGSRIDELKEQLTVAQDAVADFRKSNNMASGDFGRVNDARITELNSQLNAATSAAREAKARTARVEKAIAGYSAADVKPVLPDLMNNTVVTKLRDTYFELVNREADWAKRFGKSHQATMRLRQRIEEIHLGLLDEYRRQAESYRSEFEIATTRAGAIEKVLANVMGEKEQAESSRLKLVELDGVSSNLQKMLESLLVRQTQTDEQRSFPIPRAWIMNEATEPIKKVAKRTVQVAAVLFGLGAAIGLAIAMLREMMDRSFRRLVDGRSIFPAAGSQILPLTSTPRRRKAGPHPPRQVFDSRPGRAIERSQHLMWQAVDDANSMFARSFRAIRHDLEKSLEKEGVQVIGVTGGSDGDGVSTASGALALVSAASGARTLLIDSSLRDPALSRQLAPGARVGLLEVLAGTVSLDDAIYVDPESGLEFLPVIVSPNVITDEIMASSQMADVVAGLKSRYKLVVIDLPPLSQPMDVGLTRSFVQRYVAVVTWGRTELPVMRDTLQRHGLDPKSFASVIINKVNLRRLAMYDPEARGWTVR